MELFFKNSVCCFFQEANSTFQEKTQHFSNHGNLIFQQKQKSTGSNQIKKFNPQPPKQLSIVTFNTLKLPLYNLITSEPNSFLDFKIIGLNNFRKEYIITTQQQSELFLQFFHTSESWRMQSLQNVDSIQKYWPVQGLCIQSETIGIIYPKYEYRIKELLNKQLNYQNKVEISLSVLKSLRKLEQLDKGPTLWELVGIQKTTTVLHPCLWQSERSSMLQSLGSIIYEIFYGERLGDKQMAREHHLVPDFLIDLINRCMVGQFGVKEMCWEFSKALSLKEIINQISDESKENEEKSYCTSSSEEEFTRNSNSFERKDCFFWEASQQSSDVQTFSVEISSEGIDLNAQDGLNSSFD